MAEARRDLIKIPELLTNAKMLKAYEVNGELFVEEENLSSHDDDTLVQYELYEEKKVGDQESDDEDIITELEYTTQALSQGLIVNSNVFLTDAQWHTVCLVDGNLFRCAVCQMYCERSNCLDHIETLRHRSNLDSFKPLKRFDLSIIRKIYDSMHCGVCNQIFDVIDCVAHENSPSHGENLLTAINKVSDDCGHGNLYNERNFHSTDRNTPSVDSNTPDIDRNTPDEYHFDANAINNNNIRYAPDRDFRNNNEFHFNANAISNISVYEEFSDNEEEEEYVFEGDEYNTPCQGVSYASMASKPRIEMPKFLKIDLGTKEVRVKFESWHMITKIELNKFYCMVCNKQDHIRFRSQHCIGCEHLERLARCAVVGAFEDYLIRKVNDKLYHCGHCNNLQYQNQMNEHIERAHPKKTKNIIDTSTSVTNSPLKSTKKNKTVEKTNKNVTETKPKSDVTTVINNQEQQNTVSETSVFDIFGDISLCPFGTNITVPALSFNCIIKKDEDYYCAICDRVCADVKSHIEELNHIEIMNYTPFIKPFKCNLTRAVRGTLLHCTLCNKLVQVNKIYSHNMDQPHTNALAMALGMKKAQKPAENKNDVKYLNKAGGDLNKAGGDLNNAGGDLNKAGGDLNKAGGDLNKAGGDLNKAGGDNKARIVPPIVKPTNSTIMKGTQYGSEINLSEYISRTPPLPLPNQTSVNKAENTTNTNKKEQNNNFNAGSYFSPSNSGRSTPAGQNYQYPGQNYQYPGQNPPFVGQNLGYTEQRANPAQNHKNFAVINNQFPSLPIKPPNLNSQFLGAPLKYTNFNAPRVPYPPYPYLASDKTQNKSSRNQSPIPKDQNIIPTTPTKKMAEAKIAKTPVKKSAMDTMNSANKSANYTIKYVNDNIKITNNNRNADKENIKATTNNIKAVNNNTKATNNNIKGSNDNIRVVNDNIIVVNNNINVADVSIESVNDSVESIETEEDESNTFDEQELVFLKLKTAFFKITNQSYNTLVYWGNGIRHCFVCSITLSTSALHKHVESREHTENVAKNKFLDKYGKQLLRQMYLMYHCAICNVLMTRKEIKMHLDWAAHVERHNVAYKVLNKKNRKELKSGIKECVVETQKEAIFNNVNEPKYNIINGYQIVPNLDVQKGILETKSVEGPKPTVTKKNKMVIVNNVVMKVAFDHWHGIVMSKNVTRCVICQLEIRPDEVLEHVSTEYHNVSLGKTFEKTFYPTLLRKINENTVNCVICNLELLNDDCMINEHVHGRKHVKNHETIAKESAKSDSYADCYEDFLSL